MQENDLHLPQHIGRGCGGDGRDEIKNFVPKSTQACFIIYTYYMVDFYKQPTNSRKVIDFKRVG